MEKYSRASNCDYFIATLTIVVTITLLFFSSTFNIGNSYAIQTSAASLKAIPSSVKITFPPVGQQVPVGNSITIFGTSKYNMTDANSCAVYANVNNYRFQKATSVGPRGNNDYSSWMYTYVNNDRPITTGINSLEVKLSCNTNSANMTVYNTTRIVGVLEQNNHNPYYNYNYNNNNNIIYHQRSEGVLVRNENNPTNSSPPFWFPGLSNKANINGMNNVSNENSSDTKSMQTAQQSSNKALNIYIKVSNDSVVWGNERIVKISVLDRVSSQPISDAIVTGNIAPFPAEKTALSKSFVLLTNNSGEASYSWLIPYTNTKDAMYRISISSSALGYNTATASVISAATANNNFMQNKDESNNAHLNNKNSQVSTLHT